MLGLVWMKPVRLGHRVRQATRGQAVAGGVGLGFIGVSGTGHTENGWVVKHTQMV